MSWEEIKELDSDALLALLDYPEADRAFAAIELGERKERRAVDALINLLQDNLPPSNDGYYAAGALGKIGDKKAVEHLIAVLKRRPTGSNTPCET